MSDLTCPCCGAEFEVTKEPEGSVFDVDAVVDELRGGAEDRPKTVEEMKSHNDPIRW